jgi:hypothetical protein
MNLLGGAIHQDALSLLQDPFASAHITGVMLRWYRIEGWPDHPPVIYANVTFKNGNTTGEHKIEARTMGELIAKVQAFIETLPRVTP